jgi:hypothetical protein
MTERQCPSCGGELGLAVRPSRRDGPQDGPATSLSTQWQCSTCGGAFTAEQVRAAKLQRSKTQQEDTPGLRNHSG